MFTKSFNEMLGVDVTKYLEERDGFAYLPWANCKALLHENGAENVYFVPCVNENGSSLFMSDMVFGDDKKANRCYEVRVKIVIDNLEFEFQSPVMNGKSPVVDSYMTQQQVWKAQARAFVKGVAMRTGLGFNLWIKGDMETQDTDDDLSRHNIFAIQKRLQEEYTKVIKKTKMSTKEIAQKCEMSEDMVKVLFTYFDQIEAFEKKLTAL